MPLHEDPQYTAILTGTRNGLNAVKSRLLDNPTMDVSVWVNNAYTILTNEEVSYTASSDQLEELDNMIAAITAIIGE